MPVLTRLLECTTRVFEHIYTSHSIDACNSVTTVKTHSHFIFLTWVRCNVLSSICIFAVLCELGTQAQTQIYPNAHHAHTRAHARTHVRIHAHARKHAHTQNLVHAQAHSHRYAAVRTHTHTNANSHTHYVMRTLLTPPCTVTYTPYIQYKQYLPGTSSTKEPRQSKTLKAISVSNINYKLFG